MGAGGVVSFLCMSVFFGAPAIFLLWAYLALKDRRWSQAEILTTIAGVGCWILLGLEAIAFAFCVLAGVAFWRIPFWQQAIAGLPPLQWYWARSLRLRIRNERVAAAIAAREQREEERRARGERDADEPGSAGGAGTAQP
jgi:hypothetical protein